MNIEKTVLIDRPIGSVFTYVMNFSQLYEWDDHVVQGERIDLGPIKVGSQFKFLYSLAGNNQELLYTLDQIEENTKLQFTCKAPGFDAVDTITFTKKSETTTEVQYAAEITLKQKAMETLFSPIMDRIGNKVVSRLKSVLESEEAITPEGRLLSLLNLPYRFCTPGWNHRRKQFTAMKSNEKTILITGPTSGLGKAAVITLAGKGCNLILVGRNKVKLADLETELRQKGFEKQIRLFCCDMQDIAAVKETCHKIREANISIDVLINNAGALFDKECAVDGIERTTVVDLIAPWVMSCELIPQMRPGSCIINVSSGGMYAHGLSIKKLREAELPFSGSKAYALAKRAMVIFTKGLNQEIQERGIRVHCVHPGWSDTPGVESSLPGFYKITKKFLRTPFTGAESIIWLAMHNPEQGGEFWLDRQIQPQHLMKSTRGNNTDYEILREFLRQFSSVPS